MPAPSPSRRSPLCKLGASIALALLAWPATPTYAQSDTFAISFDGGADFLTIPQGGDTFDFVSTTNLPFTIEFWLFVDRLPSAGITANLVAKGSTAWGIGLNEFGRVTFATAPSAEAPLLMSDQQLQAGAWNHVAVTFNPDARGAGIGEKTIYLNGFTSATSNTDITATLATNSIPLTVGGNFSGRMDELRIWSTDLGPARIFDNFTLGTNNSDPYLLGRWTFDDASTPVPNQATATAPLELAAALSPTMDPIPDHFVAGYGLGPARPPQYALAFDGVDDFVEIPHHPSLNFDTALTIEAWVRPLLRSAAAVVAKGDAGYGLGLDDELRPVFYTGPGASDTLTASAPVPIGEWSHIAVTVDTTSPSTAFFIDGKPAGTSNAATINNNGGSLVIGKQGTTGSRNFFGELDEIRLWSQAAPRGQVAALALSPLGASASSLPDLTGYWNFDESTAANTGSGPDLDGTIRGSASGAFTFGHRFDRPPLPDGLGLLTPDPSTAGLWVGEVLLDRVTEVATVTPGSPGEVTPTNSPASIRLLLHVDAGGFVRLLKEVIVMRKDVPDNNGGTTVQPVLVTNPDLIPQFQGITRRGGKLVGIRFSSATFDFDGFDLPLAGGIGAGLACTGAIELPPDHPTNPFRHKFHPDHRSGRAIVRQITVSFDGSPPQPAPGFGVDEITGTYLETVTGLHKVPLSVRGSLRLTRITEVAALNDD